jgi:hypothetical protein
MQSTINIKQQDDNGNDFFIEDSFWVFDSCKLLVLGLNRVLIAYNCSK